MVTAMTGFVAIRPATKRGNHAASLGVHLLPPGGGLTESLASSGDHKVGSTGLNVGRILCHQQ